MPSQVIKVEFDRSAPLMHRLLRYTQALVTQVAQTAVCKRHHALDQQLCRCLRLSLDRLDGPELVMTQELIAKLLGVCRERLIEAVLKWQGTGLIRGARGRLSVLDRPGLEQRSCACDAGVKQAYDRLLADRTAHIAAHPAAMCVATLPCTDAAPTLACAACRDLIGGGTLQRPGLPGGNTTRTDPWYASRTTSSSCCPRRTANTCLTGVNRRRWRWLKCFAKLANRCAMCAFRLTA